MTVRHAAPRRTKGPASRLPRPARAAVVAGGAAIAVVAGFGTASALWSAGTSATLPPLRTGTVSFSAQEVSTPPTVEHSPDGSPVTVTMPGSEIIGVLEDTVVVWHFTVSGHAHGIAGMDYDVVVPEPAAGTVRDGSTTKVYPASSSGDCSSIPATQPPLTGQHLQAPGTNLDGTPVTQEWCVAVDWDNDPDGFYKNSVVATGTAVDGTKASALSSWQATIAYPPALHPLGQYVNGAEVAGTGVDGTTARAHARWNATIFPDPSGEPPLVITIDPTVTSLHAPVGP